MGVLLQLSLSILLVLAGWATSEYPQPCDDDIYCYGDILHTVQLARPFEDRKTYVDLPLKLSRATIKANFASMMNQTSNNPSTEDILQFLSENFGERGEELSAWTPEDWKPNPQFLSSVRDTVLRQFGSELNDLWKVLGKKINEDVRLNPSMHSLVYVPNGVILPGGRFLELYYWDTYWIIRGLLHCEMYESVKGMLRDFFLLFNTYGYIPNGNRIYYSRTQPPFLTQMVREYVQATGDWQFASEALPFLEREFNFWLVNRTVTVSVFDESANEMREHVLFRYNDEVTGPRPESYEHDYLLAENLESTQEKDEFYVNMKSGAESGWDFSSRWFPLDVPKNSTLIATKTSMVIPVDLNSILYRNLMTLTTFNRKLKNSDKAMKYALKAYEIHQGINSLLWDEEEGAWFDYDLERQVRRKEFYPSNIFPLWAGIEAGNTNVAMKVVNYLGRTGALNFDGGIPTSLHNSTQQWDFPNAWPPLQHLFVEALENTGYGVAKEMAFDVAQKWVASNYLAYRRYNNTMYEKYRADIPGEPGGGGYYGVVVGFGWSNGVIIDFLKRYGDRLSAFYNDIHYHH